LQRLPQRQAGTALRPARTYSAGLVSQDARRRAELPPNPVQRSETACVVMHQVGAIRFEHEQPNCFGRPSHQSGVENARCSSRSRPHKCQGQQDDYARATGAERQGHIHAPMGRRRSRSENRNHLRGHWRGRPTEPLVQAHVARASRGGVLERRSCRCTAQDLKRCRPPTPSSRGGV
jgi:hypothetical protein